MHKESSINLTLIDSRNRFPGVCVKQHYLMRSNIKLHSNVSSLLIVDKDKSLWPAVYALFYKNLNEENVEMSIGFVLTVEPSATQNKRNTYH